jgi:hypothetical protein
MGIKSDGRPHTEGGNVIVFALLTVSSQDNA